MSPVNVLRERKSCNSKNALSDIAAARDRCISGHVCIVCCNNVGWWIKLWSIMRWGSHGLRQQAFLPLKMSLSVVSHVWLGISVKGILGRLGVAVEPLLSVWLIWITYTRLDACKWYVGPTMHYIFKDPDIFTWRPLESHRCASYWFIAQLVRGLDRYMLWLINFVFPETRKDT